MNDQPEQRTIVSDIDIPFSRLVVIILKFMLASIPALIVFYAVIFAIVFGVAIAFGGGAALLNNLTHH